MSEILLKDKSFLISETDENGIITFANDDFCEISGYSLEELLGQNHNIVRHKDMPKIFFKELWSRIKNGEVWSGVVKNRTKDGSFYWVYATIYPFISCSGSKGYISCRKRASRDEIEHMDKLCREYNGKGN